MCTNAWQHRVILVTVHMEKPTATSDLASQINKQSSLHVIITQNPTYTQQQQPNASACICKQAKLSRCHGDAAEGHASLGTKGPQTNRRPDIRQRITASSSRSAANTNSKAPRCLDNFPCNQRGRQRRALGQNHAAAPQRRPRAREPFFSLECSVTAHKRLV